MNNINIQYKDTENTVVILHKAKKIITEEIEKADYKVEAIYLFGSRARGDYKEDSDRDFFVITDKNILKEDMKLMLRSIRRKMADDNISNDVIVKSRYIYENQKRDTGFLSYYVNKKGISL
ncbi:MAG: nucleotidyltransferase domain-containing protein [Candidatus Acididesulfobacter guangdongensis]|uniref:Nucleotidyltransferase domain-containing protein n=1 Tax=Acididesulfobacter guangdongensis TaxID=2597225 RepID=A0A519BJ31_ACIG2|nr:MAG: nucleotidyltransferase domain-containing protein [Candidatus Acididesulfobacter guangdongensis]